MEDESGDLSIEGTIEKIIYHDAEKGFGVVLLAPEADRNALMAAGQIVDPVAGQVFRFIGAWNEHPRFGRQFKVSAAFPVTPATEEGIRRYLASGQFPGIGTVTAERLVAALGARTLDVLLSAEPEIKVEGVSPKKIRKLRRSLGEQRARVEAMAFLAGLGLSPRLSHAILKQYGRDAIAKIRRSPYELIQTVDGIGFQIADRIAASVGISGDNPARLRAGTAHVIVLATEQGHVCVPRETVVRRAAALLEVDIGQLEDAADAAIAEKFLVADESPDEVEVVYLPWLHTTEVAAARAVLDSAARRPLLAPDQMLLSDFPDLLTDEQREAVMLLLRSPIAVLTGGPGVGKTTVLKALVAAAQSMKRRVSLAAPTGRAARRLEEATGQEAFTIHRLLRIPPDRGLPWVPEEINTDALVIDEASMLDLPLFVSVMRALPPEASLILVGDKDQLPSVGPGDVLNDLISSGVIPVARLTRIFRQETQGLIVRNAHRVLHGEMPLLPTGGELSDFYFMERADPEEGAILIRDLITTRLPDRLGFNPRTDIQVLAPMHRGAAGTDRLNQLMQETLNAAHPGATRGERRFRVGDRVIFTRNDYQRQLSNGDVGHVMAVDQERGTLDVDFGGRVVTFQEWLDLQLAFALTVHKAQGSEYPVVILPVFNEHRIMLRRAVVYTAMTRARKLLIIVGQKTAMGAALQESRRWKRWTLLQARLGVQAAVDPTEDLATLDDD